VTSNFSNMGDASLASSVCMGGDDYACESPHFAEHVLHLMDDINITHITCGKAATVKAAAVDMLSTESC
jgi:hypothetical protein